MDSVADSIDPGKLARLEAELAAVHDKPGAYPDSLKDAVCDVVDDLKANGKRPEEVVIEIRHLCLNAGFAGNQYTSGQKSRGLAAIVDKIISTCIDHYFT
jgi:hypothetical protein